MSSHHNLQSCQRCLYTSSHPFGIEFDSDGICTGCRTHEEKFNLDWKRRAKLLNERINTILGKSRAIARDYDCIIPVRGTAEHLYLVDFIKNRLGLRTLTVNYNSQFNSIAGIRNLALIRDAFDVDFIQYTTNPIRYRRLIRESLARIDSMRWPYIAGEKAFPVQVAVEKNVPLIIWPYHQPTEQVGVHSYTEENKMTRHSRHQFDLMGLEEHDLVSIGSLLHGRDIEDIRYPGDSALRGVTGIYAANYLPWDTRRMSEEAVQNFGATCCENTRTFDTYERVDDLTYMSIHDIIKEAKVGYSRVRDSLCREIRFGRISRYEAIAVEQYYSTVIPTRQVNLFLDWLGMDAESFKWFIKRLPYYRLKSEPEKGHSLSRVGSEFVSSFKQNTVSIAEQADYTTFGKGLSLEDLKEIG